jgi:predicted Zn-dependent protease
LEKAEPLARDTMIKRQSALPPNHVNTAISTLVLGRILVKLGKPDEAQPILESARSCFRQKSERAELAAESEIWLGAIELARGNTAAAEGLMLPGANYYLASSALLSKKEQCDSIKHLIRLFTTLNKPDQAANWQRRLDESDKPANSEPAREPSATTVIKDAPR